MIVEFGDEDMGQKARTGHAARDRPTGRWNLHHAFAAAAGLLRPGDLDDLELTTINAMRAAFLPHDQRESIVREVIRPVYAAARA